jgi:hypothetical protein
MKKRCQLNHPGCLGLTEKWERVGTVTMCWNCGAKEREAATDKYPKKEEEK